MFKNWSELEVEAVISDYADMLQKEVSGIPYNKTAHRTLLAEKLGSRSPGSIERKHQNISAVLLENGYPYIPGYKPLSNYQKLLANVVLSHISENKSLRAAVARSAELPAKTPDIDNILERLVNKPTAKKARPHHLELRDQPKRNYQVGTNYLELESQNQSLGFAGEMFIVEFEKARLHALNKPNLADQVEHIPSTQGDGAGFDIKSYEEDGCDRLIEVKTTAYGIRTPVFLSANELKVSRQQAEKYFLYRIFQFREDPMFFALNGALDTHLNLSPTQFRGHLA